MIKIGSNIIYNSFPDFPRIPKDKDYITQDKFLKGTKDIEILYNPILYNYLINKYGEIDECPLNELYTLKISHCVGWDINWEKHIFDIQFLKNKGCILIKDLFYDLYKFWNEHHGMNLRSDLDMTSDEFFTNSVKCKYDHDWLHTLIKPYPTFNKVLQDGEEVNIDINKFFNLDFEEKCDLVNEEIYVMAYERYSNLPYKEAFSKMLKKFVLNHAPLEEAIFIIENYKTLHKAKFDFIKHINDSVNNCLNIKYKK